MKLEDDDRLIDIVKEVCGNYAGNCPIDPHDFIIFLLRLVLYRYLKFTTCQSAWWLLYIPSSFISRLQRWKIEINTKKHFFSCLPRSFPSQVRVGLDTTGCPHPPPGHGFNFCQVYYVISGGHGKFMTKISSLTHLLNSCWLTLPQHACERDTPTIVTSAKADPRFQVQLTRLHISFTLDVWILNL